MARCALSSQARAASSTIDSVKWWSFAASSLLADAVEAFGDVLDTGADSLHHLVVGAAAPIDVAVAEAHGHVVDQLCDLEALQGAMAAVGRDQGFGHFTRLELGWLFGGIVPRTGDNSSWEASWG
jgi:hypothetical protein